MSGISIPTVEQAARALDEWNQPRAQRSDRMSLSYNPYDRRKPDAAGGPARHPAGTDGQVHGEEVDLGETRAATSEITLYDLENLIRPKMMHAHADGAEEARIGEADRQREAQRKAWAAGHDAGRNHQFLTTMNALSPRLDRLEEEADYWLKRAQGKLDDQRRVTRTDLLEVLESVLREAENMKQIAGRAIATPGQV